MLELEPVESPRQLQDFIDAPWTIDPTGFHMPIMSDVIRSWHRGTADHPGEIALLLVRDSAGRVRGRSTLHTHEALEAKLGVPTQFFGATEFADRPALEVVLSAAERAARLAGKQQLMGPAGLDLQENAGALTSGFDHPTFLDQPWNRPHVPEDLEALGFERWKPGSTWIVDLTTADLTPPTAQEFAALGVEPMHVRRRDLRALMPHLAEAINESLGRLSYFVPMNQHQFETAMRSMTAVLDTDLVGVARPLGEPQGIASMCLCIPDFSAAVREARGQMTAARQLRLLTQRRRYMREALLVVQGTRRDFEHQGVLSLLTRRLMHTMRAKGYRTLHTTFIVDDNPGSFRQVERVGGRPLHGTAFYRRPVRGQVA